MIVRGVPQGCPILGEFEFKLLSTEPLFDQIKLQPFVR